MEYNTARKQLVLPEYGRNIQKMADYLLTIEDKQERTKQAKAVLKTMSQVTPNFKNTDEFWEKLWHHLFIMTDYQLDVDCPYNIPSKEEDKNEVRSKPSYNQVNRTLTNYGRLIEELIDLVVQYPDEQKYYAVLAIANQMKKIYYTWNQEAVADIVIIKDLARLSKGKLILPEDTVLVDIKELPSNPNKNKKKNKKKKKKSANVNGNTNGNANGNSSNNNNNKQQNKGKSKITFA